MPATRTPVINDRIATESYAVKNDGGIAKIMALTQQAYNGLTTKDATTLYVIKGN